MCTVPPPTAATPASGARAAGVYGTEAPKSPLRPLVLATFCQLEPLGWNDDNDDDEHTLGPSILPPPELVVCSPKTVNLGGSSFDSQGLPNGYDVAPANVHAVKVQVPPTDSPN